MKLGTLINLASVGLATSVVMDSYLWMSERYMIPSWVVAVMSFGMILILQVVRVLIVKS